ncbi:MAG: peptidase dipeptidase [Verrucomicrobia bacterium]|jgi:cyanophycinase|nr:peptidase dipeptidase [Verrucomicrobiota bacterium]
MSIKQTNTVAMIRSMHALVMLALLCCGWMPALAAEPTVGPAKGALVVVGGGGKDASIMKRFVELAGGPSALIVVVPTAGEEASYSNNWSGLRSLRNAGATNLVILHTRDRQEADTEKFAASLKEARGVWFGGGRQWRFVDSYLGTRTEKAFHAVLERGGVIGGSSAGATIQGSYLVRGAREGNTVMMAPGYEKGFGFLRDTAVDQHWLARKRENDMVPVIEKHPHLLGIAIDEDTAIVVRGDQCEVIGASKVGIYDNRRKPAADEKPYLLLSPGDRFNLKTRRLEP